MTGFQVDQGYRLFGYSQPKRYNEEFFIECRNYNKSWRGIMGALLKKRIPNGLRKAELIFTQGLTYDKVINQYKVYFHRLKTGVSFQKFIEHKNNEEFIKSNIIFNDSELVTKAKIIYLNTIKATSATNSTAIESDVFSPDHIHFNNCDSINYIDLKSEKKNHMKIKKRNRYQKTRYIPNMLASNHTKTMLYICDSRKIRTKEMTIQGKGWYLIPYQFAPSTVTFAPIRRCQLLNLMRTYKKVQRFNAMEYQRILMDYVTANKQQTLTLLSLDLKNHPSGFTIVKTTESFTVKDNMIQINPGIPGIYCVSHSHPLHDFNLMEGTVCIFRGYEWPFKNFLREHHYEIFNQTYQKKD